MKVEPILEYSLPKYPRKGEISPLPGAFLPKNKRKALLGAVLAVSGTLNGCFIIDPFVTTGVPPMPDLLTEEQIIQILQYEAEGLGLNFTRRDDAFVNYSDFSVNLDLYNDEKNVGVAVVDQSQGYDIYNKNKNPDLYKKGVRADGTFEGGKPVDFYLATEIPEYHEETIREAFREFILLLQSEGII